MAASNKWKFSTFTEDLYHYDVNVLFDDNWQDACSDMADVDHEVLERCGGYFYAKSVEEGEYRQYYLFFPKKISAHKIAHECMHVLLHICSTLDIIVDGVNPEPSCYLIESLVEHTLLAYEDSKKRKRG